MLTSRVPSTTGSQLMLNNLQSTYRKLTELQDQISSGKQVTYPSDNPAQVIFALDYRTQLRRSEQLERNTTDARNWLQSADSALSTVVDYLQRVRDLTLQGVNGASDSVARGAVAAEIRAMRDGLLQLSQTQYAGRYIFNGTVSADLAPYSATYTYQGNDGAVARAVAPGVNVEVNLTGPEVFGTHSGQPPGTPNVFELLTQIADDLEDGSGAAIDAVGTTGLQGIDAALDRVYGAQASIGARTRRIEDVLAQNESITLDLQTALAEIEDIDLPETLIKLKSQEMAYQAALSTTARVIQPSLLDFLR